MKKVILFFILSFISFCLNAQQYGDKKFYLIDSIDIKNTEKIELQLLDSILTLYHNSKSDTSKLNYLNDIVDGCYDNNIWPRYNTYLQKVIKQKLLIHKNDLFLQKKMINTTYNYAYYLSNVKSENDSAVTVYKKVYDLSKTTDKGMASSSLLAIGYYHYKKGEFPLALKYYLKSLQLNKESGNENESITILNNIGALYLSTQNLEKALSYYTQSLQIAKKYNSKREIANALGNISNLYAYLKNDYRHAIEYNTEALKIREAIGDKIGLSNSLILNGDYLCEAGDTIDGLTNYYKALEISKSINYYTHICMSEYRIARIEFKLGNIEKAKILAEQSFEKSHEIENIELIEYNAELLANIYVKKQQWEKAYQMLKLSHIMKDSSSIDTERALIEQQNKFKYENQKKIDDALNQKKIILEKSAKEKRELIIYFSLIGFVIVISIVFMAYKKVQSKNLKLKKSLDTNETLMKELHHRVKNNLQIISSLLNLQSYNINDPAALSAVKEGKNRVKSIALIHQKLYQSENISVVNFSVYIKELTDYLKNIFRNPDQSIAINIDQSEVMLDIDTAVPLGLIINELVSNSFKYAFKNKTEGIIDISISYLDRNHQKIKLVVKDNGIGLPEKLDIKNTSSLGLKLVTMLTKQLGGEIYYTNNNGAYFNIEILNTDLRKQSD